MTHLLFTACAFTLLRKCWGHSQVIKSWASDIAPTHFCRVLTSFSRCRLCHSLHIHKWQQDNSLGLVTARPDTSPVGAGVVWHLPLQMPAPDTAPGKTLTSPFPDHAETGHSLTTPGLGRGRAGLPPFPDSSRAALQDTLGECAENQGKR